MIFTPQQYIEAQPIALPYKSENGTIIEKLEGKCRKCGNEVKHLKGNVTEHPNCIEIRFAGVCLPCKLITSFRMRYYNDGRMIFKKDDGWYEISNKSNWYSRLIDKIEKF